MTRTLYTIFNELNLFKDEYGSKDTERSLYTRLSTVASHQIDIRIKTI